MKKIMQVLVLLLLLCFPSGVRAAEGNPEAEWTVLFYLCGSDLESKYGYATENLQDISACAPNNSLLESIVVDHYGGTVDSEEIYTAGTVNVLIQTGGSKEWHAEPLGMEIDTGSLQRWRYNNNHAATSDPAFELEENLPLASMAAPETLAGFIRWGTENYPAKKTVLVLWDHGGGSKTGIFTDELFEGDVMYLDELRTALEEGGTHLEAVLLDACMMANLETACALKDHASWMIASEELAAGKGSAINDWLEQLFCIPEVDGEWLGRWICDFTQIKYANHEDESAQELLTWSVIDLSAIDAVEKAFDDIFSMLGSVYVKYPLLLQEIAYNFICSEDFGTGTENMYDIQEVFFGESRRAYISANSSLELMTALKEAVAYNVRGGGRSAAKGLSFCYAVDFDIQELETYSRNCPSPHYLAFLDAISPWTAPDWVYDTAERLPEIETLEEYRVVAEKLRLPDGTPVLEIQDNDTTKKSIVHYNFYWERPETGEILCLGTMPAYFDYLELDGVQRALYGADEPWYWPSIEGEPCCFDVVSMVFPGDRTFLGNILFQMNATNWELRCSYNAGTQSYTVYGMWVGFDSDSDMFDRNVNRLSQFAGQEFKLLYPVYTGENFSRTVFSFGKTQTMYRYMEVEDQPLSPGTYYIQYVAYDLFMRPMPMEWIKMQWDGENVTFPEADSWAGQITLAVPENYWIEE